MKKFSGLVVVLVLAACGPGDSPNGNDSNDTDGNDVNDETDGISCEDTFPTRCSGIEYQECQDGEYQTVDTCAGNETCVNGTGCVQCDPLFDTVCQGSDVYTCNDDGTVGGMVEACGAQGCGNGECGGGNVDCDAGDYIYLVDSANQFIRFDPRNDAHSFEVVGELDCEGFGQPFSMSVDREGKAWVLYSSGKVYKVDTETLDCVDSGFAPNQGNFWKLFGMGFVTDAAGSDTEKLWIGGGNENAEIIGDLGYIDGSLTVQRVSDLPDGDTSPEFTGTGAGELYAYYPGAENSFVARLSKTNGTIEEQWELPPSSGSPNAWAFAHWGGRYYIFISALLGFDKKTLRLDPTTGDVDTIVDPMEYEIVGAGVSTCAPIVVD